MTGWRKRVVEKLDILHCGFDGFDCAFQGALPSDFLAALASAKAEAEGLGESALLTFCGISMHVAPTGAPGGYRYRCDTGPEGETWFFKHSENPEGWNVRVSGKSLPLAIYGLDHVRDVWLTALSEWGVVVQGESVGRIDYAVDVIAEGFELDPDSFVFSSQTRLRAHREDFSMADVHKGRRCESVTVGRMPRRQVIVYDKTAEIRAKRKTYWRDIWGLDDETKTVWRFEFRAGKEHLKDDWKVTTFRQLKAKLGDILAFGATVVRIVTGDDQNVTRRASHPIWQAVTDVLKTAFHGAGEKPSRVKETVRAQLTDTCEKMIIGCAASLAAVRGVTAEAVDDALAMVVTLCRNKLAYERDDWRDRVRAASARHHFIRAKDPERPQWSGPGPRPSMEILQWRSNIERAMA